VNRGTLFQKWGVPGGWGSDSGKFIWDTHFKFDRVNLMDFDSSDYSSAHPSGKIKTQTFKQFQLERLIKEGKVIPASKLAETGANELQRIKNFEEAVLVEERHRVAGKQTAPTDIKTPLTRERFEELLVCFLVCIKYLYNFSLYLYRPVAEAVRFELTEDFHPRQFSRLVHSTTLPRFH
jgi:hypothetical protein